MVLVYFDPVHSPIAIQILGELLLWFAAAITLYSGWKYVKISLNVVSQNALINPNFVLPKAYSFFKMKLKGNNEFDSVVKMVWKISFFVIVFLTFMACSEN